MSFPLKRLLSLYEAQDGHGEDFCERGMGARALVAFYTCLGIQEPVTADLSANLVRRFSEIMAEELAPTIAIEHIADAKAFLEYIYAADYTPNNWSTILDSVPPPKANRIAICGKNRREQ